MIKDLGLQFNFVAYEQVVRSALSKYRVFILPFSMALSPEEAKAIREFAASGGIVIADASAGVMDDHCGRLSLAEAVVCFGDGLWLAWLGGFRPGRRVTFIWGAK